MTDANMTDSNMTDAKDTQTQTPDDTKTERRAFAAYLNGFEGAGA